MSKLYTCPCCCNEYTLQHNNAECGNILIHTAKYDAMKSALKLIVEWNETRGRGRPLARACNRMAEAAEHALNIEMQ